MIISVFIPHGGCPERCHFCDQRVSGGDPLAAMRVSKAIEDHLATSPTGRASEIAFYGGTFTALSPERQLAYLETARPYLEQGVIGTVRISTRPDALNPAWLEQLRDRFRLATVELGAQSFNADVLERLGRSHSPHATIEGVRLLKTLGLRSGVHLMIGTPGECTEDDARASQLLASERPDFVRIHPLLVLKGTPLENDFRAGHFKPLELETAIDRVALLTASLEASGIRVIRLGLQANELLGAAIVAGPYHPAFGDLVRGRIARNRTEVALALALRQWSEDYDPSISIEAESTTFSHLSGHRKQNLNWLKERFRLRNLSLLEKARENNNLEIEIKVVN